MFKKKCVTTILGLLIMTMILAACGGNDNTPATAPPSNGTEDVTQTSPTEEPAAPARVRPDTDREGRAITLPDEISTIMTIGPSNAEILVALGFGPQIIATCRFADDVEGLTPGISQEVTITTVDAEFVVNLMPDIVFVTGMTRVGGDEDPLALVSDVGITVIYMPTSVSIDAIKEDIRFLAAVMEAEDAGEDIISAMEAELDEIRQIAATIAESRTVYFEVAPMFSLGRETFLHEMIELVGGVNIFANEVGWIRVADEILLLTNPDVILTSTNFLDDPITEILERPGFAAITAVQNGDVFIIDTSASNRPNHNIVIALREIAAAVHPDEF